jgi:class 3 adenylate cyclase
MNRIKFSPEPAKMRHAIAASFDMSGFSSFCNRPNSHAYLNRYMAALFDLFDVAFEDFWRDLFKDTSRLIQVPRPDFCKYTGDGALLLWVREKGEDFSNDFCTSVVAALRNFQRQLPQIVAGWEREWRASELPKIARFGISTGPVQPLVTAERLTFMDPGEVIDYAGHCINLAVRLQDHCPAVGFIVHEPVHPQLEGLAIMRALKMKGALDEPVYIFQEDYRRAESVSPKELKGKFAEG